MKGINPILVTCIWLHRCAD